MDLVRLERAVLERIAVVARLGQVAVCERVLVDDEDPTRRQIVQVRLECCRVHGDEHVRLIAGREDVVVGEVELETGDARQRACRRPDLSRKIGVGGEVVPDQRRLGGEAAPRELHPVPGVPGEPDHDGIELLDGLRGHGLVVAHPAESDRSWGLTPGHAPISAPRPAPVQRLRSCRAGSTQSSAPA